MKLIKSLFNKLVSLGKRARKAFDRLYMQVGAHLFVFPGLVIWFILADWAGLLRSTH